MARKKTRILLIQPPFSKGLTQSTIPLGLSYIGAVLLNAGFYAKGYNLHLESMENDQIGDFDIAGIYATTSMFASAVDIARHLKEKNENMFVVIGGPHVTALPEECLNIKYIDAVVMGEGEFTMLELAEALEQGERRELEKIKGLAFRGKNGVIKNEPRVPARYLDELPIPAKHIFSVGKNYPDKKRAYQSIIGSRGCPFKCTNCQPGLGGVSPYRLRTPENVVDEIEFNITKYGTRHFDFADSEFVGPVKWVLRFCDEIIKRKLKITFSCNGRTDQVTVEALKELKRVGCVFMGYGVESGSQRVIDEILLKGIDLKQAKHIINETTKMGIGTGTWFMVGMPGETWEDILRTIDYAKALNALTVEVNIATPWPDTGFYYTAKRNGWLVSEDWEEYNEKRNPMIDSSLLSKEKVLEGYNLFKNEVVKEGWRCDETDTRFRHPDFLKRITASGIKSVLRRGVQVDDFKKLYKWVKK